MPISRGKFYSQGLKKKEQLKRCKTLLIIRDMHALETSLLQPARLLCSWNSQGKTTRVGCHSLLQGIFLTQGLNPDLPHCRQILYHLSHQGSPSQILYIITECWVGFPMLYHRSLWTIYFISTTVYLGEGDGTPLQYFCLENPMDGGAWQPVVHGVAKSRTQLSDFTFTFHFPALEKEMATHSSVLAWRIPGMGEPGELPSMGSHRVGHD